MYTEGSYCSVQKADLSPLVLEDFILFGASVEGCWIGLFVARPRFHRRILVEVY